MSAPILRALEQSVIATTSGTDVERSRREVIAHMSPSSQKLLLGGIERLSFGMRTKLLYSLGKQAVGISYLGIGASAVVYSKDDSVIKIYHSTIGRLVSEQKEYMAIQRDNHSALAEMLGSTVLPQSFDIRLHPFGKYPTVVGTQAYAKGEPMTLFTTNTRQLHTERLDDYCAVSTTAVTDLRTLVANTYRAAESNIVPDMNGPDNFRVTSAGLLLIDSVPVDARQDGGVFNLILKQAETLDQYLDRI